MLTTSENPQDQREATEELMRLAREGSIVDQIKAEGHLRQLSQSAIPEQQGLAIKPLVWFTFVSDDGYVQERSLARLKGILTHQEWSEAYKLKTIVEISEFIFGRLRTSEEFKKKILGQFRKFRTLVCCRVYSGFIPGSLTWTPAK